jgi:charged multivesicular body protein 6
LEITEVDKAVLSLKTQRRRLEDHRTRVTAQIERETLVARQLVASGYKDRAMMALKKKKLQENTLVKLDTFLLNVESMVCFFRFLFLMLNFNQIYHKFERK